ncbi:uncharacterized protein EI97DRAFT_364315, partial [Westerdykella ornata]
FSIVALVLTLASFTFIKSRLQEISVATSRSAIKRWDGYIVAQIVIWTATCVLHGFLFSTPLWRNRSEEVLRAIPYPRDSIMSEVRKSEQTTSMHNFEPTQPSSPLASMPASGQSSQSLKNWKGSLHEVVRPMTSRTKLVSRSSYSRDSQSICSDSNSMDNISHSDGFDSWDTSSVSIQAREVVAQTAPSRRTVLEPIPGSRPASPAQALDGPFPLEMHLDEDGILAPPPKLLPDISRPPSPVVNEGHIHPLFRSESPHPPEVLTPGTSIEASPLSTQMLAMASRPYNHMRSHSQTGSPSMRNQSFRGRAVSAERSRSSSPPSREMTPPIPDFVLNPSARSSTS